MRIKLINQRFDTIELKRNITNEPSVELETRFDFNVKYSEDAKKSLAILICEIRSKADPELFYIKLVNVGEFEGEGLESDEGKKEAHVECNKALFPYTQYMISNLAVRAGFPPIFIENQVITKDQVIVG